MARLLLLLPLLIIAALIAAAALLFHYFGLAGLAAALVLFVFGMWGAHALGKKMVRRAVTSTMRARGKVLRGATTEVHSVTPASPPDADYFGRNYAGESFDEPEEDDAEFDELDEDDSFDVDERFQPFDPGRFDWWHVDVTIRPSGEAPGGLISQWSPSELILIEPGAAPPSIDEPESVTEIQRGFVLSVEVWRDGAFQADRHGEFQGSQRVRLLIGAPPQMRRARFCCYFEVFGEVILQA